MTITTSDSPALAVAQGNALIFADVEAANEFVEEFRQHRESGEGDFTARSSLLARNMRDFRYEIIQRAYGLALALYEQEAIADALLAKHQLSRDKREGSNPWMPLTNLLFGTWEAGKKGSNKFVVNLSAKKYANSFRYFYEHGWPVDEIAERLKKHAPTTGINRTKTWGRGLVATEKEDRYDHSFAGGKQTDADLLDERQQFASFAKRATPIAGVKLDHTTVCRLPSSNVPRSLLFFALWSEADQGYRIYADVPNSASQARQHGLKVAQAFNKYLASVKPGAPKAGKWEKVKRPIDLMEAVVWQDAAQSQLSEALADAERPRTEAELEAEARERTKEEADEKGLNLVDLDIEFAAADASAKGAKVKAFRSKRPSKRKPAKKLADVRPIRPVEHMEGAQA